MIGRSRRRPRVIGFEALEGRALLSAAPAEAATSHLYGVARVQSNVVYSQDGSRLDVYKPVSGPKPPGGFPAIIALPGGGWQHAKRQDYGGAVASAFGPSGYVVLATDYYYDKPGGPPGWPRNVEDVRSAVRWVRRHADSLGVNPDKVIVSGESAGGHLATLSGTLPAGGFDDGSGHLVDDNAVSGKPDAVIDFYGPTDLAREWQQRPWAHQYLAPFLGGSPDQFPSRYAAASPINHVSSSTVPTFIAQGTADSKVLVSQSIALDRALKAAGVADQLVLLQGVPHGFRFRVGGENLAKDALAFLARVGMAPGS